MMKLCTLPTGDKVYRYYKCIAILFFGDRKVLSTSVLNGGYREDLTAVFNHDCNPGAGMACTLRAPSYAEHMRIIAEELGLDPNTVSGVATAASMDNVAIHTEQYEDLAVTAVVTGGVEVNGGRVGEPAQFFKPVAKTELERPGTINIMLVINADLPPGILARAVVTCTEAKTAALQELMVGSNYSTGLATGSGTDSTIVIANPQSELYFESAGKHSKLGELIGQSVKLAVKEALRLQTKLSPDYQHSVLRRSKRYGITEESLWTVYQQQGSLLSKAQFIDGLHHVERDGYLVAYTSLVMHLLDQEQWELLTPNDTRRICGEIMQLAATTYNLSPLLAIDAETSVLTSWSKLLAAAATAYFKHNEECL